MANLDHIKIVSETAKVSDSGFIKYPELGRNVKVLAVLDDESELDLSNVVTSVEWVAQPGSVPVARVSVLAPEVDVRGWVEHEQLDPREKVIRRIGLAERREREGQPRENFGHRFCVVDENRGNFEMGCDSLEYAWYYAWRCATSDERLEESAYEYPPVPATIEGANRLLEKRRRAKEINREVKIQEWVDGEWVG